MKKSILSLFVATMTLTSLAQIRNSDVYEIVPQANKSIARTIIDIPNIAGFHTLKCDFHIHSILSDGSVLPSFRVDEAWADGLDAIAMTEHLTYLPNEKWVIGDRNEAYKQAKQRADEIGFIVIAGAEITRNKPFGHANALFITDANPLVHEDPIVSVNEALKQNAFIMWNHPGWPDDKSTLYEVHEKLIKENKIHGIEVVNEFEYYPKSLNWCRDMNLAFISNSDIHTTTHQVYGDMLRPITLVFAKDRSVDGIKEAMFARRSVALFDNQLMGKKDHLTQLIKACLETKIVGQKGEEYRAEVTNNSSIAFTIIVDGNKVIIPAKKAVSVTVNENSYVTFANCWTGDGENITLPVTSFQ